jgi:alpha-tubulin suppressor-like RCC1 family protein
MVIDEDGYMWGAGWQTSGQLGNGTKDKLTVLTQIGAKKWQAIMGGYDSNTFAMDEDGYLWATGTNQDGCLGIGTSSAVTEWTQSGTMKFKKIASSYKHTVGINEEGHLYGCGSVFGLGDNNTVGGSTWKRFPQFDRVKDCAVGWQGTFVVDEYGRTYCFKGDNTGYFFDIPIAGGGSQITTTAPCRIFNEYEVERIVANHKSTARFVFIKE